MHDEVSDTENIRKNLAIERMIVEGCDILLDTSQTFVRQGERPSSAFVLCLRPTSWAHARPWLRRPGSLIQLPPGSERGVLSKVRLGSLSLRKEGERQCFLFTKHFLICTRTSGGKLHLLKVSRIRRHTCPKTRAFTASPFQELSKSPTFSSCSYVELHLEGFFFFA